jgi:hypothetical protein
MYAPAAPHFLPAKNGLASNEIKAHMNMFAAATNDGYYELGLNAAKIIQEALATTPRSFITPNSKFVNDLLS